MKKEKVIAILNKIAKIKNIPLDKDGHIDLKLFKELKEVKKTVSDLKALGVDKKWLWSNGFAVAGMLLNFNK